MLRSIGLPCRRDGSFPRRASVRLAATLLAGGAALGLGAQPAAAVGDYTATVQSVVPQQLPVLSNGSSYTAVPWNGNIVPTIHIEIDSGATGHVKSWEAVFHLATEDGSTIEFPSYSVGDSYPVFQRPHTVDLVKHLQIPAVAYDDFAVAQCNKLADSLRQSGLSNQQIFSQDRTIDVEAAAAMDVDFSGIVNVINQALPWSSNMQLLCQKWQGAIGPVASGNLAPNFQMTGAKLFISPAYKNLTADCPVTVPLVAEFTATNSGTLKFRFVSASGKVSQLYTANITGKTGGVYKTLYEKQIQVPLTQADGMGASGGGGGGIVDQQGGGGGFAVQTQPEEPIVPTAPSSGGMGQVQVNPLAGNIHSESFRVEVVQPATGIVSGYAGYRITCKPKATPGIGGAQGLTVQQPAPQPGGATATIGGMRSAQPPQPPTPQRVAPARVAPPVQIAPPQPMQMQSVPPQQ